MLYPQHLLRSSNGVSPLIAPPIIKEVHPSIPALLMLRGPDDTSLVKKVGVTEGPNKKYDY